MRSLKNKELHCAGSIGLLLPHCECLTFARPAPGTQRLVGLISFERWSERKVRPSFGWRCHRDHPLNLIWMTSPTSSKPPLCQSRKPPPRPRTYTQRFPNPFPASNNSTLVLGRPRIVIASERRAASFSTGREIFCARGCRRHEDNGPRHTVRKKRRFLKILKTRKQRGKDVVVVSRVSTMPGHEFWEGPTLNVFKRSNPTASSKTRAADMTSSCEAETNHC